MNEHRELKVIRHDSAEAIFREYAAFADIGDITLSELPMGGTSSDGEEHEFCAADMVDGIELSGLWGYADSKANEIHVWISAQSNVGDVIGLMAHEIAHLIGPQETDELAEEERANRFGDVAAMSYREAMRLLQEVAR